ncbi:quinone-dependent dihydroorotate dehydrogenase [Chitinophagales bacterium]|nr:quinone-dependent dihydroorotate dehydrogenase [Chitinophagales bacterium]
MYQLLRPLLFQLSAERAHHFALSSFRVASKTPLVKQFLTSQFRAKQEIPTTAFGLQFKNPVGLAAGFDKDAKYIHEFAKLGLGFLEIGTITPKAQIGNPQPRLFRLPKDRAIINRMGFNNEGVFAAKDRLQNRPSDIIIGGNIGKNKITPNEEAVNDYLFCFEELHELVDYFVVNVSSPNTPGLRELQDKKPLGRILSELQNRNKGKKKERPILLKIAPDLGREQLEDIAELASTCELAGLVATNTTIDRSGLVSSQSEVEKIGAGGLSGAPVKEKSAAILRELRELVDDNISLIGVGGIMNPADAKQRMEQGADLVQIYSGLIYYGPHLPKDICAEISL